MSNELVIDGISFAKKSESLQGKIAVSRFERVKDSLASLQGELAFRLDGELDDQRRASLRLSVFGHVQLTCQRCLADFVHELVLNNQFVLVAHEADLPDINDEDSEVDFLVAEGKLNVQELIEDEIILSLPLAPRHGGECLKVGTDDVTDSANPFAKLAKPH